MTAYGKATKHLVYAYLLLGSYTSSRPDYDTRIMLGKLSPIEFFPYMASIQHKSSHTCGGSIIGRQWVLTAGHCLHDKEHGTQMDVATITISIGSSSCYQGRIHPAEAYVLHEGFNYANQVNDIALVKSAVAFAFDEHARPVQLDPYPIEDFDRPLESVVAGWGLTETSYYTETRPQTEELRHAEVNTIPLPYCKHIFAQVNDSFVPIETNICVFTMVGRGTCSGDSGGPLVRRGKQIGILSVGGFCENKIPEVYTRISSYFTWIQKAVGHVGDTCGMLYI